MWKQLVAAMAPGVRSAVVSAPSQASIVPRATTSSSIRPASIFLRGDQPPPLFIDEQIPLQPVSIATATAATTVVPSPSMIATSSTLPKPAYSKKNILGHQQFSLPRANDAAELFGAELATQTNAAGTDPIFIDRPLPTMPSPLYIKKDPLVQYKRLGWMPSKFRSFPWASQWASNESELGRAIYIHRSSRSGPNYFAPLEHQHTEASSSMSMLQKKFPNMQRALAQHLRGHRHASLQSSSSRHSGHSHNGHYGALTAQKLRRHRFVVARPTATAGVEAAADTKEEVPAPVVAATETKASSHASASTGAATVASEATAAATPTPVAAATAATSSPSIFSVLMQLLNPNASSSPSGTAATEGLYADSVKRKRVLKMKRHKLKKRAKQLRNKNIGAK